MKSIAPILSAFLVAAAAARAGTPVEPVEPEAATATATVAASASPASKTRCIRDREIGSNRIKRVCLPEDQLRQLTPEQRTDLIRSERSPAEVLGD